MQSDHIRSLQIVLASARPDDFSALSEILFGSRWELVAVANLEDAEKELHRITLPIVFCDQALAERSLKRAIHHLSRVRRRACVVMLADEFSRRLWAEVVNADGYDLLARPFERDQVVATLLAAYAHCRPHQRAVPASAGIPVVSSI